MDWGTELWDQFEVLERHTQWGLDLLDRYVKFVKERAEVEQAYAKQLRSLVKKYLPKRSTKDDPEFKFSQQQSFVQLLLEVNDFAGQRELVAENLSVRVCLELAKYSQEMKQERKMHFQEGRRAQQQLETGFKQLENSKRKFERDCREAEKAAQTAERLDHDINATKADVEKAKQQAHLRSHMAEESKNEYAAQLQRFNRDQAHFYFSQMPQIFDKLQDMDERRATRLGAGYGHLSEAELQVVPIIGKCLEGMKAAADSVDVKNDSLVLIELHKSGFARPGDLEFEDFSQPMNRVPSDSSLGTPDGRSELRGPGRSRAKRWPFGKKNKPRPPPLSPLGGPQLSVLFNGPPSPRLGRDPLAILSEISKSVKPRLASFRSFRGSRGAVVSEDFSHLPPEQQRKRLQQQIEERNRELQKEVDQREALKKMKDVYEKTPQMGDPTSLEPRITETLNNIERLKLEVQKYEAWLAEAESRVLSNRGDSLSRHVRPPDPPTTAPPDSSSSSNNSGSQDNKESSEEPPSEEGQDTPIYTEFDEDFEEPASPIGHCVAIYHFEGSSEGTISMSEGEDLSLMEEDKGDGWTRVRRKQGGEGYVPTSYLRVTLN
uniref:cdc42-interacting protein 4 isoform X5 n=1 Tax=Jaculus jaculus TaxID=51337 RepID=UPI0003333E92|nr:cdc42-interacting protein 4 isoform X5 [Jaculus jaculus]